MLVAPVVCTQPFLCLPVSCQVCHHALQLGVDPDASMLSYPSSSERSWREDAEDVNMTAASGIANAAKVSAVAADVALAVFLACTEATRSGAAGYRRCLLAAGHRQCER